MVCNLRPRDAAKALGTSESQFWALAKRDPEFPQLIRLSARVTIVRSADIEAYVEKKAKQSAGHKDLSAA